MGDSANVKGCKRIHQGIGVNMATNKNKKVEGGMKDVDFDALKRDPFIGHIVEQLHKLWILHGCPSWPDGPSTRIPVLVSLVDPADMGDWDNSEEIAAEKYNSAITNLYRLIDICYVGNGEWHTQYNKGSIVWLHYTEDGHEIIDEWILYEAWDAFCTDPYNILN